MKSFLGLIFLMAMCFSYATNAPPDYVAESTNYESVIFADNVCEMVETPVIMDFDYSLKHLAIADENPEYWYDYHYSLSSYSINELSNLAEYQNANCTDNLLTDAAMVEKDYTQLGYSIWFRQANILMCMIT